MKANEAFEFIQVGDSIGFQRSTGMLEWGKAVLVDDKCVRVTWVERGANKFKTVEFGEVMGTLRHDAPNHRSQIKGEQETQVCTLGEDKKTQTTTKTFELSQLKLILPAALIVLILFYLIFLKVNFLYYKNFINYQKEFQIGLTLKFYL